MGHNIVISEEQAKAVKLSILFIFYSYLGKLKVSVQHAES